VVDTENRVLEVVVDDEQLSLAIGKKGQNVRLASRLCGWKIDIKSEQEKKREVEAEMERMARDARELDALEGVTPKMREKLAEAGFRSVDQILMAGAEGLSQIQGVGPKTAEKIAAAAQAMFDTRPEREEAERLRLEQEEAAEAERRAQEAALLEGFTDPVAGQVDAESPAAAEEETSADEESGPDGSAVAGSEPAWAEDAARTDAGAGAVPPADRPEDE
jgi:N utilization substance protein A